MIDYIIDGINIRNEYGVYVSESTGIVDIPEQKERTAVDWAEYHGEVVDVARPPVYKTKVMTLKCVMQCSSATDIVTKAQQLTSLLSRSGFRRLEVALSETTRLYYDVVLNGPISFNKKWRNDSSFAAEFDLVFKETEPMKMVLRYPPSMESSSATATLNLTTNKSVMICWGDGTTSNDVYGKNIAINHDYGEFGEYVVVIHGDIDNLTINESNLLEVWNRLL